MIISCTFPLQMFIKLCVCSKFGKHRSGHRIGKGQFSFQSQKKDNAKECSNYHTIALISHTSKVMLKILQARFQQYVNCEFPDVQAAFRQRNQRSNCQHPLDHQKSKRIPEKHLLLLYWLCQSLWLCGLQQTVENSSRDGNTRPPYLPPAKPICRSTNNS